MSKFQYDSFIKINTNISALKSYKKKLQVEPNTNAPDYTLKKAFIFLTFKEIFCWVAGDKIYWKTTKTKKYIFNTAMRRALKIPSDSNCSIFKQKLRTESKQKKNFQKFFVAETRTPNLHSHCFSKCLFKRIFN